MAQIIRGTTPTIVYKFHVVDVEDITNAVLTIKQCGGIVIEKGIAESIAGEDDLSWVLSQEESLSLKCGKCFFMLNWLTSDGTRGASKEVAIDIIQNQKNEVIV